MKTSKQLREIQLDSLERIDNHFSKDNDLWTEKEINEYKLHVIPLIFNAGYKGEKEELMNMSIENLDQLYYQLFKLNAKNNTQKFWILNDVSIIFYKYENDIKYRFKIDNNEKLNIFVLENTKIHKVNLNAIPYVLRGVKKLIMNEYPNKSTDIEKDEVIIKKENLKENKKNFVLKLTNYCLNNYNMNPLINSTIVFANGNKYYIVSIILPNGNKYTTSGQNEKRTKNKCALEFLNILNK